MDKKSRAALNGTKSQVLKQIEQLQNDVTALRCVSGLLAGQTEGANAIDLSELTYILDPIIERQKEVIDEIRDVFKSAISDSMTNENTLIKHELS
ncbi:MAG: hypothetical protein PHY54_17915 [Methylococcales bacterium]|nr:hypothetical protein [Methylococcales bacterium]